jgi:hypothetical protein
MHNRVVTNRELLPLPVELAGAVDSSASDSCLATDLIHLPGKLAGVLASLARGGPGELCWRRERTARHTRGEASAHWADQGSPHSCVTTRSGLPQVMPEFRTRTPLAGMEKGRSFERPSPFRSERQSRCGLSLRLDCRDETGTTLIGCAAGLTSSTPDAAARDRAICRIVDHANRVRQLVYPVVGEHAT